MKFTISFILILLSFSIFGQRGQFGGSVVCFTFGKGYEFRIRNQQSTSIVKDKKELYADHRWEKRLMDPAENDLTCEQDVRMFTFSGGNQIITVSQGHRSDILLAFAIKYDINGEIEYVERLYYRIQDEYIKREKESNDIVLTFGRNRDMRQRINYDFNKRIWKMGAITQGVYDWPSANQIMYPGKGSAGRTIEIKQVMGPVVITQPLLILDSKGPKNSGY